MAKTYPYFLPLLPVVITVSGNYLTRSGETVVVTAASDAHDLGCLGAYANGVRESWHRSGRILPGSETVNDIVSLA